MKIESKQTLDALRADVCNGVMTADRLSARLRDFLCDYANDHCVRPRKIVVRDKFTHQAREVLVPCGKCHYCTNHHQGEWVSRMCLHTAYCAKNCYFVTLTYRSFDKYDHIPKVLRDAYFRFDTYNEHKRPTFSPCLLRHEHVVRFMKYLRKIHGSDPITFFQGSEYGSTYGRPHHHFIIWCNEPLKKSDIVAAWSARVPHYHNGKPCTVHIGRVDFHDLNANGTIVADGREFHDASSCFKYVSKYVCKQFVDPNNSVDAKSRLNLFIDDLAHYRIINELIDIIFSSRIKHMCILYRDWAEYFADYVRDKEFEEKAAFDPFIKYNKNIFYDYETSPFMFQFFRDALVSPENLQKIADDWYHGIRPAIFRKIFKPYCNASRACGIGGEYLQRHLEEYSSGKYNLPKPFGDALVLPMYFVRKTKEYLYRFVKANISYPQKPVSGSLLINTNIFRSCFPCVQDLDFDLCDPLNGAGSACNNPSLILPDYDLGIGIDIQKLIRSQYAITDYLDRTRCLVFCPADGSDYVIRKYRYNRSTRVYDYVKSMHYSHFLNDVKSAYLRYSDLYYNNLQYAAQNLYDYNAMYEDLSLFVDTFISPCRNNLSSHDIDEFLVALFCQADADIIERLKERSNRNKPYKTKKSLND